MSENQTKLGLSDSLALERTKMANERTFLAYVRTSLYFMLSGFAFINLENFERTVFLGYLSICISAILICVGIINFFLVRIRINKRQKDL